jgi:hypothetical protein
VVRRASKAGFTRRRRGANIARVSEDAARSGQGAKVAGDAIDGQPTLKEAVLRLRGHARVLATVPEEIRTAPQRVAVRTPPADPWGHESRARRARAVAWSAAAVAVSAGAGLLVVLFSRAVG